MSYSRVFENYCKNIFMKMIESYFIKSSYNNRFRCEYIRDFESYLCEWLWEATDLYIETVQVVP